MFKRLIAAASVSVIAAVGLAPAASAAPRQEHKIVKGIDWDAPQPAPTGAATNAIDWD
ncbi:hypothetical protein [Aeromicrobium sp.]|uniref:hypothetical protein n=1 Tax=Aeromicrobium sp. TaxID=1871063 RepID=UPI0030BCF2CA